MTRVLVTGAGGFIGRHAVAALRARSCDVHVVGRTDPGLPDVAFHEADLLDAAAVNRVLRGARCSHLLHLAWSVPPGSYWHAPSNLDWVLASLRLVRDFVEAGGTRVAAAGTCAEYGWGPPVLREDESAYAPRGLYGAAKDSLRRLLSSYAATVPFSFTWGHVFFLYGPGEPAGRLVSEAVRCLRAGLPFDTTDGLQRRDFLHVADVGGAFAAILDTDVRGPVNIGSGRAIAVRDILGEIGRQTGRPELIRFGVRPLGADEPAVIEAATGRLRDEVGFESRFGLADGIADTLAWWHGTRTP